MTVEIGAVVEVGLTFVAFCIIVVTGVAFVICCIAVDSNDALIGTRRLRVISCI